MWKTSLPKATEEDSIECRHSVKQNLIVWRVFGRAKEMSFLAAEYNILQLKWCMSWVSTRRVFKAPALACLCTFWQSINVSNKKHQKTIPNRLIRMAQTWLSLLPYFCHTSDWQQSHERWAAAETAAKNLRIGSICAINIYQLLHLGLQYKLNPRRSFRPTNLGSQWKCQLLLRYAEILRFILQLLAQNKTRHYMLVSPATCWPFGF